MPAAVSNYGMEDQTPYTIVLIMVHTEYLQLYPMILVSHPYPVKYPRKSGSQVSPTQEANSPPSTWDASS